MVARFRRTTGRFGRLVPITERREPPTVSDEEEKPKEELVKASQALIDAIPGIEVLTKRHSIQRVVDSFNNYGNARNITRWELERVGTEEFLAKERKRLQQRGNVSAGDRQRLRSFERSIAKRGRLIANARARFEGDPTPREERRAVALGFKSVAARKSFIRREKQITSGTVRFFLNPKTNNVSFFKGRLPESKSSFIQINRRQFDELGRGRVIPAPQLVRKIVTTQKGFEKLKRVNTIIRKQLLRSKLSTNKEVQTAKKSVAVDLKKLGIALTPTINLKILKAIEDQKKLEKLREGLPSSVIEKDIDRRLGAKIRIGQQKNVEAALKLQNKTDIRSFREKVFRQSVIAGLFALGVVGVAIYDIFRHPGVTKDNLIKIVKDPRAVAVGTASQFRRDPVGVIVEFIAFNRGLRVVGRGAKASPMGRFIREEIHILRQPKIQQPFVRAIIKSSKVQEKINPRGIKQIRPNFMEIKTLSKLEARVLAKTLRETDAVVFGSTASRTLGGKRLPLPGDIDIGVLNVQQFAKTFIKNMPKNQRILYRIKGQKLVRVPSGKRMMDVKPLSRIIQQRDFFGRGVLPVVGFQRVSRFIVKRRAISKIVEKIGDVKLRLKTKLTPKVRRKLLTRLNSLQAKLKRETRKISISDIPKVTREAISTAFEVPTQKLVKIKGIKFVGFGEQTTRKGLGTLQVLIEKNINRAKDPQGFLVGLKVQLISLKRLRPKTGIGRARLRARINVLSNAIKLLSSKKFARLLEQSVPGITKKFPLVAKINTRRLKKVNIRAVNKEVARKVKRLPKPPVKKQKEARRFTVKQLRRLKTSRKKPSRIPKSRIPKSRIPKSRIPRSRIPRSRLPSGFPSKLRRSRLPSELSFLSKSPSIIPTFIPISQFPTSKLPPSKLPPSRLPPSRIPPSRIPPSKIPPIRRPPIKIPPKKPPRKIFPIDEEKAKKKLLILTKKAIAKFPFIYLPDLYSRIFGVKINPKDRKDFLRAGKIFTGLERRGLR